MAAGQTTYEETGLPANTNYERYVRAFNTTGEGGGSHHAGVYTLAEAPADTQIVAFTSNTISLEWYAGDNPDYTQYGIYRSTDGSNFGLLTSTFALNYTDTGLVSGTTYYYRICAFNGSGIPTAFDSVVSTLTLPPPPPAPANFTGTALSTDSIKWNWDTSPGATSYNIIQCDRRVTDWYR